MEASLKFISNVAGLKDVKEAFKLRENHREFVSPALDVLAFGWCYGNIVFFIPFLRDQSILSEGVHGIRFKQID